MPGLITRAAAALLTRLGPPPVAAPVVRTEPQVAPLQRTVTDSGIANPQPWLMGMLGAGPSATGIPVTPLTALQSAAVYGCVKCRSEDLAKLPIVIRRRRAGGKGWEIDLDHPLNRLFRRPNRWMTWFQFVAYLVASLDLRGNAYVAIARGKAGQPLSLIPLGPDRVSVLLSPKGELFYHVHHPMIGTGVTLHADDVIHIRNMSLDGYLGVSPIAAGQDAIGLALATQQHGAALFRQGAQVSGVLKIDGDLSIEAAQRLRQSWQDIYGGVANAAKVAVLEQGAQFQKIALTNEEAQYLLTRGFQVLDICRLYRVPPHKVMDLSRATFSNIEEQNQSYIDEALMPTAENIEQEFEAKLLWEDEFGEVECEFDFDRLLRGNLKSRMEAYQIAIGNGMWSVNEARGRERQNPIEGGDEHRFPLNMTDPGGTPKPADGASPTPSAAAEDAEGEETDDEKRRRQRREAEEEGDKP